MAQTQKPVVNAWYTNLTGQLFKVRFVMYNEGRVANVMIEYVNGTLQTINHHEWECLKLIKHSYSRRSGEPNKELVF